MPQMIIQVEPEVNLKLTEVARAEGMSKADLVVKILKRYVGG